MYHVKQTEFPKKRATVKRGLIRPRVKTPGVHPSKGDAKKESDAAKPTKVPRRTGGSSTSVLSAAKKSLPETHGKSKGEGQRGKKISGTRPKVTEAQKSTKNTRISTLSVFDVQKKRIRPMTKETQRSITDKNRGPIDTCQYTNCNKGDTQAATISGNGYMPAPKELVSRIIPGSMVAPGCTSPGVSGVHFPAEPSENLESTQAFLERARFVDLSVSSSDAEFTELLTRLAPKLGLVSDSDLEFFNTLLVNLVLAQFDDVPLALSLRKSNYSLPDRYNFNIPKYSSVKRVIDRLVELNFIGIIKGNQQTRLRTRIWPSDSLKRLFKPMKRFAYEINPSPETILLKNKEGELIDYPNTRERDRLRKRVEEYNELVKSTNLTLGQGSHITDEQRLSLYTHYFSYRVFNNGSWNKGGRFYGPAWQNLPKDVRCYILINGSPADEVDFKALHPTMLYNLKGLPLSQDPYAVSDEPEIRGLAKMMFLIALNAKNRKSAISAFVRKVYENSDGVSKLKEVYKKFDIVPSKLFDMLVEHNAPIRDNIGSGVGLHLQNLDSIIMARVMNRMTKKRICILGVHDSALVANEYTETLIKVMKEEYKRIFGFDIEVSVEPGIGKPQDSDDS